ncbi:hypothetical protein LOK49_LG12G02153 [Camellia lanceoleosa]|uniref:Uncharacterized protein n=1 Tax=Camellia lanceoleosa TaxID=1840588 RepID=A0ACC0FS17_9ERIC|nr:hypothetical protein LOK49_LG12G02153 [Camellia lanceoleosa]
MAPKKSDNPSYGGATAFESSLEVTKVSWQQSPSDVSSNNHLSNSSGVCLEMERDLQRNSSDFQFGTNLRLEEPIELKSFGRELGGGAEGQGGLEVGSGRSEEEEEEDEARESEAKDEADEVVEN